ncbi:MAG: FAD-dependent oxidoreductase [Lachnospira sp.]
MAQDIKTADIAIIGTGPAGISAAITAKIRNKEILLFGAEPVSSKVAKAHRILNYPGLPAVSGEELAQAYKRHLDELQIAVTKKKEFMPSMQWAVTLPFRQEMSSTGQTA